MTINTDKPGLPISLIVGLGNPGMQHANLRHNIGVWFVQALCDAHHVQPKLEKKFFGSFVQISTMPHTCRFLIPETYMNNSGRAVAACCRFYKIPPQQVLVVHDELDFPAGKIRLKQGNGHGGHNGIRDIIQHLNSRAFLRLRLGIGRPEGSEQPLSYVLKAPSTQQELLIRHAIDRGLSIIPYLLAGEFERAFRQLHQPCEKKNNEC